MNRKYVVVPNTYTVTPNNKVAIYIPPTEHIIIPEVLDMIGSCILIAMQWESNNGTDIILSQMVYDTDGDIMYDVAVDAQTYHSHLCQLNTDSTYNYQSLDNNHPRFSCHVHIQMNMASACNKDTQHTTSYSHSITT
jgi:hypothetical protein